MKNKLKDIATKIIAIIMIIYILCPYFTVDVEAAVTQKQAAEAIASFAIDFFNKYGERVYYPDKGTDVYAQRGGKTYEAGPGELDRYVLDCVGWCSYAIYHATGLDRDNVHDGSTGFVTPTQYSDFFPELFEDVTGQELEPGDILANYHHVMLYVGDDKLIDSRAGGPNRSLTYTTLEEYGNNGNYQKATYGPGTWGVYDKVYRITQTAANEIKEENLCKIALDTKKSTKKKKDYGYYGLPSRGGYTGSESLSLDWLINLLSQIADFLIGIITMGIKMELIGWATILENIVTDAIQTITNTDITAAAQADGSNDSETGDEAADTNDSENGDGATEGEQTTTESKRAGEDDLYTPSATETVVGFKTDRNDRITVEKIIYNQIPMFDVNVFDLENAGGQPLNAGGTLSVVKNNIAKWYVAFRGVAIVGLLLVLVYVGIRMTISTVASEKATYKRLLADWAVSFIIVVAIHYFMIFVINVNESLVEIFKNMSPNQEVSLYETVRTKAYEIKFSSGMVGTVLYLFLVYILFRYIFLYLKRYLSVNLLVIIAPIIGISYAIDKIKDNKSQSLTAWMKDFSFMVLLQAVHALVYTVFVSTVLDLTSENIAGAVLGMIVLNSMLKADKIVLHIFGMDKSKSLSSLVGSNIKDALAGLYAAKAWGGMFYKGATGAALKVGRGAGKVVGTVGGLVLPDSVRYGFNGMYNSAMGALLGDHVAQKRRTNNRTTVSGIDKRIQSAKLKNKKALSSDKLAGIMSAKKRIVGFAKLGVAIPMAIADPGMLASYGIFKLSQPKKNGRIVYKASAKRRAGTKTTAGLLAKKGLMPVTSTVATMRKERKEAAVERKKKTGKAQRQIAALESMQTKEEDIVELAKSLRESKVPITSSGENPLATALGQKFEEEFDHVVEEQLKQVDKSYIEAAVQEYADEAGTRKLQEKDIVSILDKVEEELRTNTRNRDHDDPTKLKVEIERAEAIKNIRDAYQKKVAEAVADEVGKPDEIVFSPSEIVDIFKSGLDEKSSVQREEIPDEYQDIIEQMEELQKMSKAYKKEFKEEVYTNSHLKASMKMTKRAQDFDLYRHLIGEDYL